MDNPYYHATRLELLAQLGIRPSTISLLDQPIPVDTPLYSFGDLATYWNNNFPIESDQWFSPVEPVALFIHFLVNEVQVTTPANLLTHIIVGRFSTFPQWVDIVLSENPNMDVASLERAWMAYQFSLTAVAQAEPPIALPEKEIQLLCTNAQNQFELYRYNVQDEQLTYEGTMGALAPRMMALPDGDGVVIGLETANPTETRLLFWVNGRQSTLSWLRTQETPDAIPLGFDPTDTFLILGGERNIYGLMDMQSCLNDGDCNFETTDGFPTWFSRSTAHLAGY